MEIWLDNNDDRWHVLAEDAKSAAQILRDYLIARHEIGKYTPVTVELMTETHSGNIYREVW